MTADSSHKRPRNCCSLQVFIGQQLPKLISCICIQFQKLNCDHKIELMLWSETLSFRRRNNATISEQEKKVVFCYFSLSHSAQLPSLFDKGHLAEIHCRVNMNNSLEGDFSYRMLHSNVTSAFFLSQSLVPTLSPRLPGAPHTLGRAQVDSEARNPPAGSFLQN